MNVIKEELKKRALHDSGNIRIIGGRNGATYDKDGAFFPSTSVHRYHPDDSADNTYITVSRAVIHNGICYANSNHNMRFALYRNFNSRCAELPDPIGAERDLRTRAKNALLIPWIRRVLLNYVAIGEYNYTTHLHAMKTGVYEKHPKMQLRIDEYLYMVRTGDFSDEHVATRKQIKIKTNEWAKPGKCPRTICDLGVRASLHGVWLAACMKKAFDHDLVGMHAGRSYRARFVAKPGARLLEDAFNTLLFGTEDYIFIFFSDDSCVSILTNGTRSVFNMDIETCDLSHSRSLHEYIRDLYPEEMHPAINETLDQLRGNIQIHSPGKERKCKLYGRIVYPVLLSGSGLTTIMNNFLNLLLFMYILDANATSAETIIDAISKRGYSVTLEECKLEGDVQFLKHSPTRDNNGRLRAVINLGVFFRSAGCFFGDLPGRGNINDRAKAVEYQRLRSTFAGIHFPYLDLLRSVTPQVTLNDRGERVIREKLSNHRVGYDEIMYFCDADIFRRYQLTDGQIQSLRELTSDWTHGSVMSCDATDIILLRDYGIPYGEKTPTTN